MTKPSLLIALLAFTLPVATAFGQDTVESIDSATAEDLSLTGTIVGIEGAQLILEVDSEQLKVDMSGLAYNPVNEDGGQELQAGSVVTVSGKLDRGSAMGAELNAESIRVISNEPTPSLLHQGETVPGTL